MFHKKPYRKYGFADSDRVEMVDLYCDAISSLPVSVVNVVINKTVIRNNDYGVLDNALTYSIQHIENDLAQDDADNKFIIVT